MRRQNISNGVGESLMEFYFLRISLKFQRTPELSVTEALLKSIVLQALRDLHGEYGASIAVEVLEYKEVTNQSYSFVIKILECDLVKVWSGLTLLGTYNGVSTMFSVEKVSRCLKDSNDDGVNGVIQQLFQK
ncbi:ribonuclease P protein subunit p14-like [Dysidea avara]|uniref:ribonuclease P protein subunit p14-like n=1 Tax=Dysidea avara TaxID=196820 RepID=UPI00331B316A